MLNWKFSQIIRIVSETGLLCVMRKGELVSSIFIFSSYSLSCQRHLQIRCHLFNYTLLRNVTKAHKGPLGSKAHQGLSEAYQADRVSLELIGPFQSHHSLRKLQVQRDSLKHIRLTVTHIRADKSSSRLLCYRYI